MIRYLLMIACLATVSHANVEKYFIKFGSFKNLQGLKQHINKLPQNLRTHVAIVQANGWYIPFAYYTSNKNALRTKVAPYRRYFKDAHIARSASMMQYPLVYNYAINSHSKGKAPQRQYISPIRKRSTYQMPMTSTRYNLLYNPSTLPLAKTYPMTGTIPLSQTAPGMAQTLPIAPTAPLVTHKVVRVKEEKNDLFEEDNSKKYKHFSKQMLSGKSYYLAYKKTKVNPALLIKVTFENHQVSYQPVIGDMKMTKANYLVENHKLYMFADTFTPNGTFSTLDEHHDEYFIVSSWVDGKKLNTLRYYYRLNDAKRYLGIRAKDGLSEILSEGDYDDFMLDE